MKNGYSNKEINSVPINILLVEDNESDVKIALRAFSKVKIKNEIYVTRDGQEALDFIYHDGKYKEKKAFPRPDLILLDIKIPKLDGFQVLERIKSDLQYNSIPVIMFTSSKNEEDIARSYKGGAASFIPKPIDYDEFVKLVEGFDFYWRVLNKLPSSDTRKK